MKRRNPAKPKRGHNPRPKVKSHTATHKGGDKREGIHDHQDEGGSVLNTYQPPGFTSEQE